jgi:hypothetical protein
VCVCVCVCVRVRVCDAKNATEHSVYSKEYTSPNLVSRLRSEPATHYKIQ